MHLFISAGEPSGDLHASNLIRSFKRLHPEAKVVGLGGDKMQTAGAELLFNMIGHAVMGFGRVVGKILFFKGIADRATRYFKEHRPDAVLMIDFSGFNLPLARRAKEAGIPVCWFLPPQLWAWRGWRVRSVRKWVDHVICALPFEYDWYRSRHVPCSYAGHPYFDELEREVPDALFMEEQRRKGGRVVALLPGSRKQEIAMNATSMLNSAEVIHQRFPDTRFLVAAFNEEQAAMMGEVVNRFALPVEVLVHRTPEIIRLAEACISVSGSVGLELMYSAVPTAVLFRVTRSVRLLAPIFIKCKYMSLVNLLAKREIYPEFPRVGDPFEEVAERVIDWLEYPAKAEAVREELRQLKSKWARPGACDRAARMLSAMMTHRASGAA